MSKLCRQPNGRSHCRVKHGDKPTSGALTLKGYSQLALNRSPEARAILSEAVSIVETLRAQTAGGVEERQRYFEGGLRAHHGMLEVLVKENQPCEALVLGERAKARGLLDILHRASQCSENHDRRGTGPGTPAKV